MDTELSFAEVCHTPGNIFRYHMKEQYQIFIVLQNMKNIIYDGNISYKQLLTIFFGITIWDE